MPIEEPQLGPDGERLEGVDYSGQTWVIEGSSYTDQEVAPFIIPDAE